MAYISEENTGPCPHAAYNLTEKRKARNFKTKTNIKYPRKREKEGKIRRIYRTKDLGRIEIASLNNVARKSFTE